MEKTRVYRDDFGILHLVFQLQLSEAATGGLDESMVMLKLRIPGNHHSSLALSSAFSHAS